MLYFNVKTMETFILLTFENHVGAVELSGKNEQLGKFIRVLSMKDLRKNYRFIGIL